MRSVFGINFSRLRLSELVTQLVSEPISGSEAARLVVTANLDHVVNLTRNRNFRDAYSRAWVATADGAPIYLYAKARGVRLPERVSGPDLFEALMLQLSAQRHRPFFIVSKLATGAYLEDWLVGRGFDRSSIEVVSPRFGFENDTTYSLELAARIKSHGATHLILGVGAPKSEIWVDTYRFDIGGCYALGIGAGVDFFTGVEKRAPLWMRRSGLEWMWRVAREPQRLSRRYFVDSWRFFLAIKNDLWPASGSVDAHLN